MKQERTYNIYFSEDQVADSFCGAYSCAVLNPLVKSHRGCRLTPGQTSFHGRNKDVSPNPLFPLLKWIFPSCQRVKSGFSNALADSELPFPIGSASPVAFLPTVWYNWFPIWSLGQHSSGKLFVFHLTVYTNLLRLDTVRGLGYDSHVPADKIYHESLIV